MDQIWRICSAPNSDVPEGIQTSWLRPPPMS
jgi:hypothetical protein